MIFGTTTIEQALGVKVIQDTNLERDRKLWREMIAGNAPWNDNTPSLRLASGICKETARYTTFELKSEITGSARADYLQEQYIHIINSANEDVVNITGGGSCILKPYVHGLNILSTTVLNDCYYPLKYNDLGDIVSVVFSKRIVKQENKDILNYTLLEKHEWNESTLDYEITHDAFVSKTNSDNIGNPVSLASVEEWAHLQPNILYKNIPQPLFVEVNMPNMKSIFADAVNIIEEADKQYGYTNWEYYAGKTKIHASIDIFKNDERGKLILPDKDIYVALDAAGKDFPIYNHSPELRDESLFRGLNEYKRTIEFIIGFAYGIISDPNQVEKTAEEIRAGKQRFLVTIQGIQKIMQEAYEKLIKSMDILATIYNLAPQGKYDVNFTWGDSIMEDPDKEYARRKEMVAMGLLKPEQFVAWYFGIEYKDDEATKQALANIMPELVNEMS